MALNNVTIMGRLPAFSGNYTPGDGEKSSRMNWAVNVQLNTTFKTEDGRELHDEALLNFTAWGYYADMLKVISDNKETGVNVVLTGRLDVAYAKNGEVIYVTNYTDKNGNEQIRSTVSIYATNVVIQRKVEVGAKDNTAFNPKNDTKPIVNNKPANRQVPKIPTPPVNAGRLRSRLG